MRRMSFALALLPMMAPAFAGDVGVSINIAQPGFYGQITLGDVHPPVVYAQPVVVQPAPEFVAAPPIYLHVPPGYEKHWKRHCAEYHACGRPVYFVREDWYQKEYLPRHGHFDRAHEDEHRYERDHDRDHGHGHDHDEGHHY